MRQLNLIPYQDVASRLKKINASLYRAIDVIPSAKHPPVFLARYGFGDDIVKDSQFWVPQASGELSPVLAFPANHLTRKLLTYSSIPTSLVLKQRCEVYVDLKNRIIPLNCIEPGYCFGLFETFAKGTTIPPVWQVSAGARSLFMLPKITDHAYYAHLKKRYHLQHPMPTELDQQVPLFQQLIQKTQDPWACELLIFTKDWFKNNTACWAPFKNILLDLAWQQTQRIRNEHAYMFLWEKLMSAVAASKIKASPYQIETIKHLMTIQMGGYPAFAPATSESSAPIETLQNIYAYDYGLKENLPILMEPVMRREHTAQPVYYSLSHPTMPTSSHLKHPRGIIHELNHIQTILASFKSLLKSDNSVTSLPLPNFSFFHVDNAVGIESFDNVVKQDTRFLAAAKRFPDLKFPTHSQFARGCIQL